MAGERPETDAPKVDCASSHSERRMLTQKTLDAEQKLPAELKANLDVGINANQVQLIYDGAGTATAKRAADHRVPQSPEPQGLDDSESVVSELIKRLKESLSEQTGSWWRASMAKVANRPLLASYETSSDEVFSRTAQIQDELVSGPNENSVFSSNWHDRLQWAFHRVLALRESQDSRSASQLRRRLFERELGLSHEVGSFAAAARAAAVVLLHSLALEEKAPFTNQPRPTKQEQPRKGPAQCFVRIKPGEYPTLWSIYRPKFADDQVYVFDSLVLTVIVGEAQANVKTSFAKEVYLNDIKGRQAMADAVYATSFARKSGPDLHPRSCSQLRYSQQRNLQHQVDTVWDLHDQNKFERAKLGLPIACLIDYAGFAVLVEPLLPLSPAPVNVLEELVADIRRRLPDFAQQCGSIGNPLGCFDALDKVDRATYHKFKNIAGFLNLADYPFARGASDFDVPLPQVALWRSQVDQFCIFRNLHETLPPKYSDGKVLPEQRFRREFVSRVFHVALPCTSREQHRAAEVSASNLFQRHVTIRGTMETLSLAVRSLDLAIKQDLVPTINALQKNFLDSYDVSHALHSHGINIRNMAQLLDHGPSSPFKDAIIREIVARSAKHLFRLQVEKLIGSGLVETSHIEEIQRLVVKLFNLVLSKNEESRIFWRRQILPLALERYKVDLSDLASPENVCTFSLFKAMEYNLSVQFDDSVAVRSNDSSGEASLELRLPLTVADLSTFSTGRDSLLFAHVSQIRAALLGSYSAETRPHDDEGDSGTQLRSTKQLMRHFENAGRDKERGDGNKLETPCTVEELKTFAELRAVRGFYPRVHLVAPDTLALMQAAVASTAVGSSSTPLDVLLDNMKAGVVVPASREEIWGSGNFALHGTCGAIRAALMGTGYPCHPYCLAFDEDEVLHEAFLKMADENRAQSPLKQCLRYKRRKLALTLALLSKAAIGSDIFLLGKILQQTAYIMLQHNEVREASSIADFIYSRIPNGLSLQSEALLIDMQCTTKGNQPQDALICYRNLKPILVAMEGKMSLRLLLAHLMLASFAFKNKRFNSAILHAFRVHRISTVCFDTGGAHWAAVAALRLIARSMLEVQRCSEAVIILQHTVRAATANPELPTLVTHMSRFWLAAAFARMGRLENASVEAQSMLAGLESQLGANHEATISALYLAAEVKMRIGCLALQNPPLKILGTGSQQHSTETEICGAPSELQEPLLWKPLTAEDFEVYEEIFRDREMIQARAVRAFSRKKQQETYSRNWEYPFVRQPLWASDCIVASAQGWNVQRCLRHRSVELVIFMCSWDAEQLFLALFRRLLFREDNVFIEVYKPPGLNRKQRLRQIFSTLKQILKLKLCSLPVSVLRLVAHRIYVACVAQSCSSAVRTFGLMEQDQVAESEQENGDGNSVGPSYLGADRTRVYFKKYPRLQVGRRRTSAGSPRHLTTAASTDMRTKLAHQVEKDSHPDYPFSFYSQQKVSGTGRRNAHGHEVLYARVDGSSGLRPAQEHDDIMLQLLLFGNGPSSLNGILKSCYMSCLKDRDRNPSTWFDDMISDVLTERGSLQHLRFLICMLRQFFTLSQKSLFITLALGDFNRKHAKIFVQTMRTQEIEAEVSRKLVLKRMINKSREKTPESTDDYFEYDFNSPRPFDLTIGISQCEDLLNSTTWTGSALRVARSQLDFTLTKQALTKQGPTQAWQQFIGESEPLEGAGADDEESLRATVGAQRSDLAAVEENYLKIPPVGKGDISGKTTWRSMSTAARLSQIRFGGSKHLIANMPPIAYGVMRDIFKPQRDSELEAFGCIECLQPPDKVPFIGG